MKAADLAWAAGLFDGEGCICNRSDKQALVLRLAMACEDAVRRFAAAVERPDRVRRRPASGVPKGRRKDGQPHKVQWVFEVYDRDAPGIFAMLRPYLSQEKREQGDGAVARRQEFKLAQSGRVRDAAGRYAKVVA